MDAVVRYSPHSSASQQRFLILKPTQHSLQFYRVKDVRGSTIDYKQLSQHTDFPTVRAFDWSPSDEAIVAVGLSTGEAALLRIDDSSNGILPFSFKNPRPCNAIALSSNGYLAAGLDRARNDCSLHVWDVNQRLATWDRDAKGWTSTRPQHDPLRKLVFNETVSSIKFSTDVRDTLVAGVKGKSIGIYDLREYSGNAAIQLPTRCTHNLSIDTQDENYFASASNSGEPMVCVWDRRAGVHSSAASLSSGMSQHGHSTPVLEFKNCMDGIDPSTPSTIWSVRFCKSRRGALGVLSNVGQLKVYETAKVHSNRKASSGVSFLDDRYRGAAQLLHTKRCREMEEPYRRRHENAAESTRIDSFDFMSSGDPADKYRIIAYRCNGSLEVMTLRPPPPTIQMNINGEMSILTPRARSAAGDQEVVQHTVISPSQTQTKTAETLIAIRKKVAQAYLDRGWESEHDAAGLKRLLSHREARLDALNLIGPPGFLLPAEDVLALGNIERRRVEEGYLFNCGKNIKILADDPGLQDLWRWIQLAEKKAQKGGMIHERLDLSFLGVHNVWKAELGPDPSRRISGDSNQIYAGEEFLEAVRAINKRHNWPAFKGVTTAYPELRQLCLGICGYSSSPEEFEKEMQRLLAEESRTKAAAWALLHGYSKRAVEAVMQGNDAEKLIAMALAAFYNTGTKQDDTGPLSDLCNDLSEKTIDPWSRAILGLVSTENWKTVIDEASLPLRDRIDVAFKHLNDEELTLFLEELTNDCVREGDIEGIWLTGITEEAADLFQNYIIRHNDVQTAVLVMSYSIPVYFDDDRFQHWRETYCHNLKRYKLHVQRCHYVVQHTKRSKTRDGVPLVKPPPRQFYIKCNYCERPVVKVDDPTIKAGNASSTTTAGAVKRPTSVNVRPANPPPNQRRAGGGLVCPGCGRHMPRCGVCMLWLGIPREDRPDKPGGKAGGKDPLTHFMTFCNTCHHGFHSDHANQWFAKHQMCPVAECKCLCAALDTH
ncbi:MAG: hypothetical protein M1823_003605 [Watsoniomyces obsoletus]|nr:MAG: hypothetical protein M1823_003605 [Watsoniomyces obsoletus]